MKENETKRKTRWLSAILSVVLLLGCLPVNALAVNSAGENGAADSADTTFSESGTDTSSATAEDVFTEQLEKNTTSSNESSSEASSGLEGEWQSEEKSTNAGDGDGDIISEVLPIEEEESEEQGQIRNLRTVDARASGQSIYIYVTRKDTTSSFSFTSNVAYSASTYYYQSKNDEVYIVNNTGSSKLRFTMAYYSEGSQKWIEDYDTGYVDTGETYAWGSLFYYLTLGAKVWIGGKGLASNKDIKPGVILTYQSDTVGPDLGYSLSTSGWTNGNVTLYLNASDTSGLAATPYYCSSTGAWQASNAFTITANGTYTIQAMDSLGNVSSSTVTISNIDRNAPSLGASLSTTGWTKGPITLTINASDSQSGVQSYALWGVTNWQSSNQFTISSNGTYTLAAMDWAGNYANNVTKTVSNIDTTGPTISGASQNTTAWATSKTVTISASDSQSGLHATAYSFDGGSTWQASNAKTVTASGTYNIKVRDAAGNTSSTTVTVTNIDRTGPTVSASQNTTAWATSKTVTISASDSQSGLHSTAYSFNGGAWSSTNVYTVAANGTYTVKARDALGNVTSTTVTVTNIDTTKPSVNAVVPGGGTLTISATDVGAGLAAYYVSLRADTQTGGEWLDSSSWSTSETYVIGGLAKNTDYYIFVKDKVGNLSNPYGPVQVCNAPGVPTAVFTTTDGTLMQEGQWTNQGGTITVTAGTEPVGGQTLMYKQDNDLISSGWKNVPSGGIPIAAETTDTDYYIRAFNASANNLYSDAVLVTVRIDTEAPTVRFTPDTADWSGEDVVIRASATDAGGSKLHATGYSYDGGVTWSSESTYTATETGTYTVTVRDNAGNTATVSASVQIDKVVPEVAVDSVTDTNTNDTQTVTVTAEDEGGSALSDYRVVDAAGKTVLSWTAIPAAESASLLSRVARLFSRAAATGDTRTFDFTIAENGDYTVEVRDGAGNVSEAASFTVAHIYSPVTSLTLDYTDDGGTALAGNKLTVGQSAAAAPELTYTGTQPNEYAAISYRIVSGGDFATIDVKTGAVTAVKADGSNAGEVVIEVTVTNYSSQAVSGRYTMQIVDVVPEITAEPGDYSAIQGRMASFRTEAAGLHLTYRWYRYNEETGSVVEMQDGVDEHKITVDENGSTLTITTAKLGWSGCYYYCVVSNSGGEAESEYARLFVNAADIKLALDITDTADPEFPCIDVSETLEGSAFSFAVISLPKNDDVAVVDSDTIKDNYGIYGTDNANSKVSFTLVVERSDGSEEELEFSSRVMWFDDEDIVAVKAVRFYNAAAYNHSGDRTFTISLQGDGVSATIKATVKGVTEKTLIVDLPIRQTIALRPGIEKEAESGEMRVENGSAFPLTVALGSVTPVTEDVDVTLPLIAGGKVYTETEELLTSGVMLGVKDGQSVLYYDPSSAKQTNFAALTPNASKTFRYFMEFSPTHSAESEQRFAYQIGYRVEIPADDLS